MHGYICNINNKFKKQYIRKYTKNNIYEIKKFNIYEIDLLIHENPGQVTFKTIVRLAKIKNNQIITDKIKR